MGVILLTIAAGLIAWLVVPPYGGRGVVLLFLAGGFTIAWSQLCIHVRGWEARWHKFDEVLYRHRHDGIWHSITFEFRRHARPSEILVGDLDSWRRKPEWMQAQRGSILRRLQASFPDARLVEQES